RGLRRSALDRCGDPVAARRPGRESAHGPTPPARQLPARVPAWLGEQDLLQQVRLDALPPERAGELLTAPLGDEPALEPLKRLLVRRGNPFFIEESIRTLV